MNETLSPNAWIKPPDPFSFNPEKWYIWKSRFLRYLSVSGKSEKSDKEKINLLVYLMGEEAELIYKRFSNETETLDYVCEEFDQYFNLEKQGCLRASFRNQGQDERECPVPSTSGWNRQIRFSQGFDAVSSSTDDSNQESFLMPDLTNVKLEMNSTTENNEGDTMGLANGNSYRNYFISNNLSDIAREIDVKTEGSDSISVEEMNLKIEDCTESHLSDLVNDFEYNYASGSSLYASSESQNKRQKTSNLLEDHNYSENISGLRDSINILNDDCLLNIFNYLTIRDLIKIERVCKRWRKISLESWKKVKNLDIKTEFKTKSIQLDPLEGLLRRSGEFITRFDCSWLNKNTHLPANISMEMINKYCKKLTHLDISYTWSKKNYLEALDANLVKNLKSLTLGNNFFSDAHLPVLLENAVNLEEFGMVGYNYDGPDNKLLNLSEKCKTVAITNSKKFTDRLLQELLEKRPNIENLDISATGITPTALFPFTNRLKSLSLWQMENFFEVDLRDYESLKCPNLRILDLNMNDWGLSGEILKIIIENCPAIEDLRLKRARYLNRDDFKHLKKLKKLKYLDVSYTKISEAHLVSLAEESKQLKKLFCYGCPGISESGLKKVIAASPELSYLAILSSKLTRSFIKSVLTFLQERNNKVWLTISLRSNCPDRIPEYVKLLNLKDGIDYRNKSNILRLVSGLSHCQCSFYKTCICLEDEDTLLYFG